MLTDTFGNYQAGLADSGINVEVVSGGGSGSVLTWDGTGDKPSITGPGLLLGTGAAAGQTWQKTTSGTSNSDWVAW